MVVALFRSENSFWKYRNEAVTIRYFIACTDCRNHQGSTPLDLLQRMHTDSVGAVTLLQQLQEDEQRRNNVARVGIVDRLVHSFRWLVNDVLRDLGWKTALIVVAILLIVAWQVTVYLHGQSPFHSKTIFQQ